MTNIVVIGSSNTDMVVKTAKFPVPGETILGGEFFMFPGGKGANQAVAAARMGGKVVFICKTGNDIFGANAIEGFKNEGIDVNLIKREANAASGVALITVDDRGENTIVVAPGANDTLSPADIQRSLSAIQNAEIVLLQLEIPMKTVEFVISTAVSLNKRVVLNPAPARELSAGVLSGLYLITPNETEAALLTGVKVTDEKSAVEAAEVLLSKGVRNVIITLGSAGAFFKNRDTSFLVPAPKVKPVDTTAAGDVFNGALAVELANAAVGGNTNSGASSRWEEAIATACMAASISVTRMGAQSSAPLRSELEQFK